MLHAASPGRGSFQHVIQSSGTLFSFAEFKRRVPTRGKERGLSWKWHTPPEHTSHWQEPRSHPTARRLSRVVWREGPTLVWRTSNLCPKRPLEQHKMPVVRKWKRLPQVRMMPTLSRERVLTEKETSRFWMQWHGCPLYLHSLNCSLSFCTFCIFTARRHTQSNPYWICILTSLSPAHMTRRPQSDI